MFRAWVEFQTEHTVFCCKFNLLPQHSISFSEKVMGNIGNINFLGSFTDLMGIILILSLFYCYLLLTLLCCKFGTVEYHALFGVKHFQRKIRMV